ncbi:MAG: threonine synthase [Acidobacteriota bacterium]|nr:threonine synthase [Acidobacteriota bacterium]
MTQHYICSMCATTYPVSPELMVCPACTREQRCYEPLRGVLEVVYESFDPRRPFGDLVRLEDLSVLPVGNTPLCPAPGLRRHCGVDNLFVKYEAGNPTGSYKDRASLLVAAFARRHGYKEIALASSGNAGSSMAGIGAACGLKVTLFLPKTAPRAKMVQALQYGARLILVDGPYDLAYELSLQWTAKYGGMNRNTGYHPMTNEGKKSGALELVDQLGYAPDHVFVPTGDGVILAGILKGFRDLYSVGMITAVPTLWAVQAEGSSPLCRAFETGVFDQEPAATIADSICVAVPRNGYYALAGLKRHDGRCIAVSDEAILEAQQLLSRTSGLFTEPAGAVSLAGYLAARKSIGEGETVVLMATGSGLKDIDAAMKKVSMPSRAVTDLDQIEEHVP